MFIPGVNGSIIANSNAPSGSRLKGAYKNSKKRKMPNGGSTGLGMALEAATYVPGPVGMYASGASALSNIAQGDYMGAGLDALNIATAGAAKGLMGVARAAHAVRPYSNLALNAAQAGRSVNRVAKKVVPVIRAAGTVNEFTDSNSTASNSTMRVPQRDNTQVQFRPNPNLRKMPYGGIKSSIENVSPQGDVQYNVSKNLKNFRAGLQGSVNAPGMYAGSVTPTLSYSKNKFSSYVSPSSLGASLEGDKAYLNYNQTREGQTMYRDASAGYNTDKVNLNAGVNFRNNSLESGQISGSYNFNPNFAITGNYGVSQGESGLNPNYFAGFKFNKTFKEGGNTSWTPTVPKPYMRTMQEPPGGYRDNMKVVTPYSFIDSATRARIDAQQEEEARRKRSGVISQGTPRSAYEKAKEASSFVSQAERRKGFADPLDYVLDMVNPAAIGFAGTDLVGNTGSAVSNVAQGNFKEAGSDLLNAGLNTLQIIPAIRGLRGPLKSASKYLTTNTALKNTYKYNPLAFKPNSEAYYRVMPEAGAKDLINSGFVRPAEGSLTSYFNKGVPLDIRRARTFGNNTREAYHGYKGPYMVESNNPNAFDPWLQFPEPSLKFYQTKAPISASDIKLYKEDWLRGYKQIKKPGLKEGGKIDHSNDKDMVNGVASILRRVKDKKNRLQLANQLSKQFNREKVKYDLPSFLNKSKVNK
jgi:hypothetical protein